MELIDQIQERLDEVTSLIAGAAAKAGRSPSDITLVTVSKTHSPETLTAAVEAGVELFGESKVQEAKAKIPLMPGHLHWHFIGHLQKNKIRAALPLFELFHSVDSLELAEQMNRIAAEEGLHPRVLLQVNVAGESSKFGFSPDQLKARMESVLSLDRLQIEGVMTIPPLAPTAEESRPHFVALRKLRDELSADFEVPLPHLSMGMSHDFVVAVEEGATLVRVGTRILGERRARKK